LLGAKRDEERIRGRNLLCLLWGGEYETYAIRMFRNKKWEEELYVVNCWPLLQIEPPRKY
jgi:hypothetical protein